MAIARDTATQINSAGTYSDWNTTGTWSHTCTGTNRILLVGIETQPASNTAEILTGVTYNGNAMTQLVKQQRVDGAQVWCYVYGILDSGMPASGNAANIVATCSERSLYSYGGSASYTGVAQATPLINGSANSSGNTCAISLTTTVDNSWLAGLGYDSGGVTNTASTNTAEFNTILAWGRMFDTNAAQTPAGSKSMAYTYGGGAHNDAQFLATVLAPYVVPVLKILPVFMRQAVNRASTY